MNPWIRGGHWSSGAMAGLASTESSLKGISSASKDIERVFREHFRLAMELNSLRKKNKKFEKSS